jgi:hypothetical protein
LTYLVIKNPSLRNRGKSYLFLALEEDKFLRKGVRLMWTRDWSNIDWEIYVEHIVELSEGKRDVNDMYIREDELEEFQRWTRKYDPESAVKFEILMFLGLGRKMKKEEIMHYLNDFDAAEEYVNNYMVEHNIPRPWLYEDIW